MRGTITFASILLGLAASTAVPAAPPPSEIELDGAAQCAAAKSALAARPPRAPISAASADLDVHFYHLALSIDLAAHTVGGTVRVAGTVVNVPLAGVDLDLADNMAVSAAALPDATPLAFTHAGGALHVALPAPVAPGGAVAVDVTYAGMPIATGFGSFVFGTRAGDLFAWSLSEPYGASDWWPCEDHPADKADSVRVTVTVPAQYRVGSQGLLVSESTVGPNKVYDWLSHYPISSYLVSVAAGEYVPYQTTYVRPPGLASQYGPLAMPLEHLAYDDGTSALPFGWANASDDLEVLEDWFGPYPFATEKYGHSECTFGGGMEHQTMTSLGGSSVALVTHELGHSWYGDAISPRSWAHVWLNEGFATYAELLYWQARAGVYPGSYEAALAARYEAARDAAGTLVVQDTTTVGNLFNYARVYAKGAAVLHMLRNVAGDAAFKDILRGWTADPAVRYGVATSADFQRVAEAESGLDLDAFFAQWVTPGFGIPAYRASSGWLAAPGGGFDVWTTVEQSQSLPASNVTVFVMPLDVAVQTTGGEERFRVQNDARHQVLHLHVDAEPLAVAIDPDAWILRAPGVPGAVDVVPGGAARFAMSPNPARRRLQVEYAGREAGPFEVAVFDVAGRCVLPRVRASAAGGQVTTLDVGALPAGTYILRLRSAAGDVVRRFVKVK